MKNKELKQFIDSATGREKVDLVVKNAQIVDVFSGKIVEGDLALKNGLIVGIGAYEGENTFDAHGSYLLPGLIDSHVHIESSYVDPSSFARLLLPRGTTTTIVDPHEICNVAGLDGFDYMVQVAKDSPLSIFFMLPSCVPSTPFETSGATLLAKDLAKRIGKSEVLGLGEMMDTVGTLAGDESVLDKLNLARVHHKVIDGHAPQVSGKELNAYAGAGVLSDHECTTVEELEERIARGMYVLLREGSATKDLKALLPGVTAINAHRCLFCTDDRQPESIIDEGHIDNHLRIAVAEGLDPLTAIRMATINAATCYSLHDRGAIAPGRRGDFILVDNLKDFRVSDVFIKGKRYQANTVKEAPIPSKVETKINIRDFSSAKLRLLLKADKVRAIGIIPSMIVTNNLEVTVQRDGEGYYQNTPTQDIVKLAVIERHKGTGNVALALLAGYGLKEGAIATTIAHDSHNIIVAGDNDADMVVAIESLQKTKGGIVIVRNGQLIDALALPIAGLMTNKSGEYVSEKLSAMLKVAYEEFRIPKDIDPFMTLSFMALPVVPHLKVTDRGLFDVDQFKFIPIEV
ncbi:MAG: adenine deaminase [Sphaerochaetaceae bacterium]